MSTQHLSLGPLQAQFNGRIVVPDDDGFEDARSIFNSMIELQPAVIAEVADPADIAEAISFARANDLEIAVRGGGHSVAGACLCDGGLTIDLRKLNSVTVDPQAKTATVGGGATWADVDQACAPHNLATTGGRVSTTGVAGLTLGGGSGWLERSFGLACDALVSVELVTADGATVRATSEENPELFWALHGGGGNFGVATELTLSLHDLPATTLGLIAFEPERGPEVIRVYRDMIKDAPEALGGGAIFVTGPPEEFIPESLQGELTFLIAAIQAGTEAETRAAIKPILDLDPAGEMIAEVPYAEIQSSLDDPPGFRNYWSAEHLNELPDEAIDRFCARSVDMVVPSPSQQIIVPWGGAVSRGDSDTPTARGSAWVIHPLGLWDQPGDDEAAIAWARDVCSDLRSWASGDVYLNFTGDEGQDRVAAGFGSENYRRLQAVKNTYDPDNVFHRNHNIKPNGESHG